MSLPQLRIYRDKTGIPLLSNMDEPNATRMTGSIPMLGGGGTPQSRYAAQQAQLASRSQYDQEVADAAASRQRQQQILNAPQLGMSDDMQQRINSAIEQNIKAGQQDMTSGANRVQAKYAGQQLGDLLSATNANAGLQQRGVENMMNAQQQQNAPNRPDRSLSKHFESTADGIVAIDPITGEAKPVMGAGGVPLKRAMTDLELQQKLATMKGNINTQQAIDQATGLLPVKREELGQKTEQAINEKQAIDQLDSGIKARGMGESVATLQKLLYEGGAPIYDKEGKYAEPATPRILSNTPVDQARMALYEKGGVKDDLAANTISVRNAGKQVVMDALGGKLGTGVSNADVQFLQEQFGILSSAQNSQSVYRAVQEIENRKNQIAERSAKGIKGDYVPQQTTQPNTTKKVIPPVPEGENPDWWNEYHQLHGG